MNNIPVLSKNLKLARRQLDNINELSIIEDFKWNISIKQWVLKCKINLNIQENEYVPPESFWYFCIDDNYPVGDIDVYPDKDFSIKHTFQHQRYNGNISENGWRSGELCLDETGFNLKRELNQKEPTDSKNRLKWYGLRAIFWIKNASTNTLVKKGDNFEIPYIIFNIKNKIVAFQNNVLGDLNDSSGIAKLKLLNPTNSTHHYDAGVAAIDSFYNWKNILLLKNKWGAYIEKVENSINAIWIKLDKMFVKKPWEIPHDWTELIKLLGEEYNVKLDEILSEFAKYFTDNENHIMLIGFPISKNYDDEERYLHWICLELPIAPSNTKRQLLPQKMIEIVTKQKLVKWIKTDNWTDNQLTTRLGYDSKLSTRKILLIGVGALGGMLSEMLVKAGCTNIELIDSDNIYAGNLCRHVLDFSDINYNKALAMAIRLNRENPFINARFRDLNISPDNVEMIEFGNYDVCIDCSGSDDLLRSFIRNRTFDTIDLFSFSFSIGIKNLFALYLKKGGASNLNVVEKMRKGIFSKMKANSKIKLPIEGIGCWHPVFPGGYDDVAIMASLSLKFIIKYMYSQVSIFKIYNNITI